MEPSSRFLTRCGTDDPVEPRRGVRLFDPFRACEVRVARPGSAEGPAIPREG